MSDSELSDAPFVVVPPDPELERSLRSEVQRAANAEKEYTVRSIRAASENALHLDEGWYKAHAIWNARSKNIIQEAASEMADGAGDHSSSMAENPSPKHDKRPKPGPRQKRASPAQINPPPRKKRKTSLDKNGSIDDLEKAKPADLAKRKPEPPSPAEPVSNKQSGDEEHLSSDSDLSEVIDDQPAKRQRSKSKDIGDKDSKKSTTSKSKVAASSDPQQEEIKKLQGQLVKCGIRKVWGKELKPYETAKAKIQHLRKMLADAGMTGRFSNEKADQIREARELAADIEAVKEGDERWGAGKEELDEDDEDGSPRVGRRLVRGSKNYDFLSDGDGEETD